MNRAQHGPAVPVLVDHHAQAHEVKDLVELLAADHHLFVDAPEVLRATSHLGLDAETLELVAERAHDLTQVRLALGGPSGDHLFDFGVALGVQRREAEVLQLPFDLLDTESVGQGRVDVERFLGNGSLAGHGHDRDRAHVVQTVGQFDEQHPPVVGHRDEHLADGGGLLGFLGVEFQAVQLGDAVDHRGDLIAELLGEPLSRNPGVFDGVVQQGRGDRGLVESEVGDDTGDRNGVGDVGLAGTA